jgi:two-component system, sensor histidine kinase and response regulator
MQGERILLVEDNKVNQMVAEAMLKKLGVKVDVAANGEEAISKVTAGNDYAVVLMDCQMPVLDGFAATREIRAWEAAQGARRVPIVAMTAHATEGSRVLCIDAGMDDYLSKPVSMQNLGAILGKWIDEKAAE